MSSDELAALIFCSVILIVIISLVGAIVALSINLHKFAAENMRLRGDVERLKNIPKYSVSDMSSDYEMPRPLYERPYGQGFEQRQ